MGRQSELEQLKKAREQAKAGYGQVVGVMGEPGVGKSRLFHEFKVLSQKEGLVLETFSVSHGKASAYLPLIELLKTYFQITPQDDERTRREKVTGKVLTLERQLEDVLPYLFVVLGVEEPTSSLPQMDPRRFANGASLTPSSGCWCARNAGRSPATALQEPASR